VPDVRNSKVIDIYCELRAFGVTPLVHDPLADPEVVRLTYGVELSDLDQFSDLDGIIYAVPHQAYEALDAEAMSGMVREGGVVADVKSKMDPAALRGDIIYWSL
jgi:UDP-N-acetyl-D-galactosamine dehydrogenase